ncbi:MAG TPA: protein translocase subunit SecF [Egibacteraceae bacterium]|nr:protein translocase subunit SecF [Egibacteraceae bacterium]
MSQTITRGPATGGGFKRFFTNQSQFDFVGRSRMWALISLVLIAVSLLALGVRQLNFGIDFTGGTTFIVTGAAGGFGAEDLREAVGATGVDEVSAQVVDGGEGAMVTTPSIEEVGGEQQDRVLDAIAEVAGVERGEIDVSAVGPRWGEQISRQAIRALVVFLVLVALYIAIRFEWRMALAALVTLAHDVIVTVGIYALVGFQVTPASVIALLTILGYSLYDTVVVFDRVTEDTARLSSVSTQTYGEVANSSLNEVLIRSLSTSVTSLLPVGSLLFIGATLLGAETLSDLALALFVGMAIGTYSSIAVATPALVWLKEREPRYAELKDKIETRRGRKA